MKKRLGQLKDYQEGELVLSLLQFKKHDLYFIDDAVNDMPIEILYQLVRQMEFLSKNGAAVIFLGRGLGASSIRSIADTQLISKASAHWFKSLEAEHRYSQKIEKTKDKK